MRIFNKSNMKKIYLLLFMAAAASLLFSCKSQEQMLLDAEKVIVKCNPSPLCVRGGKVEADLAVNYPADYFNPKAIMEVTPVIVYEGGEVAMEPLRLQGEKVKDNYRVVRSTGSTISQRISFPYLKGMAKCHLELRSRCTFNSGKKWTELPVKKVADGCNITETLAQTKGFYSPKDHGYQEILKLTPEGQVMYTINSAEVKKSELKSQSIKDFKAELTKMTFDERAAIKDIEVVAYASPDGKEDFNNKLSTNRSKTANKAFDVVAKDEELTGVRTRVKSVGEDWKGFQEMVAKSDMEDKDLILRVLRMYSDPNVREREIRNMASIYQDLAEDVLPQLRRARFIANVEYTNYSEEELLELIRENADILDEPALLKAASLCKDNADRKAIYRKAVEKFNSAKAEFALACVALDDDDIAGARAQLAKCDQEDPDVVNMYGVCYLREGNMAKAEEAFEAAATADAVQNQGICSILTGRYNDAVIKCGTKGINASLARAFAGRNDDALTALKGCDQPVADYIRAVILNRKGDTEGAKAALQKACAADSELAERSATDMEFVNLR